MNVNTKGRKGRSKDGVNKAALIREALNALGLDATAKDVQEHIGQKSKGVSVAPAQISNIRTKLLSKKKRKTGRKADGGQAVDGDMLIKANNIAKQLGGIERARTLYDILCKVRSN